MPDLYLFSDYTSGMNFSDMAELEWKDVHHNQFTYNRNKTDALIGFVSGDLLPRMFEVIFWSKNV